MHYLSTLDLSIIIAVSFLLGRIVTEITHKFFPPKGYFSKRLINYLRKK